MDATGTTWSDYRMDIAAYSASILKQGPLYIRGAGALRAPDMYADPGDPQQRQLSNVEASATIAQAVAVYRRIEQAKGTTAAIEAVGATTLGGEQGDPPPTRDENLLGLFGETMETTFFMFAWPDPRDWTWEVTGISVDGTDTARVTYSAAAPAGSKWHFTHDSFTKRLRFERRPDGTWLLAGWLDYAQFESRVRASIEPSSAVPDSPIWWESLGLN
jgi:hypothetical protein